MVRTDKRGLEWKGATAEKAGEAGMRRESMEGREASERGRRIRAGCGARLKRAPAPPALLAQDLTVQAF